MAVEVSRVVSRVVNRAADVWDCCDQMTETGPKPTSIVRPSYTVSNPVWNPTPVPTIVRRLSACGRQGVREAGACRRSRQRVFCSASTKYVQR